MDNFVKLSPQDRKVHFEMAAERSGRLGEHIIEKDFWVCWMLKRLFSMPLLHGHVIFKGGTSLSKVFRVIERFSEDIDLSLSKEILGFTGARDPENAKSAKQRNKRIEEMADACAKFVSTTILLELTKDIRASLGASKNWSLAVDAEEGEGQTLLFEYPSSGDVRSGYIPKKVKVEFGARSDHWPAHEHELCSYLADFVDDSIQIPHVRIKTLDAARTFWEKATILHSYANYPEEKMPAARQSRHYYDLYQLLATKHRKEAMEDLRLLARVAEHKSIYFRAGWAKYDDAKKGSLRLVPGRRVEEFMRKDYGQMQEMIFGEAPSWSEILDVIGRFEAEFNT